MAVHTGRFLALAPLAVLALAAAGCAPEPLGATRAAIVGGVIDEGLPAVVMVADIGGLCTGTVIAPNVVLTAKHCVRAEGDVPTAPEDLNVYVGPSRDDVREVLGVREVRIAAGTWDVTDGTDVAVLVLDGSTSVTPIEVSYDAPVELLGRNVKAIGYGLDENDEAGFKKSVETTVVDVWGPHVFLARSACSGDSGGPLIGPDGRVWGVTSHGPRNCDFGSTYVSTQRFRELIEDVLDDARCAGREETCNGRDDDCDGQADEGCTPMGDACSSSEQCAGELCASTPEGRLCTATCNPLQPTTGCPSGFYCAHMGGCAGLCTPVADRAADCGATECTEGHRSVSSECETDDDCASKLCLEGAHGVRRCLSACTGDAGMCLAGEVCSAGPGECGGCVPAGETSGPRGYGEPCSRANDCTSGICHDAGGTTYCSHTCSTDRDCGENFHCGGGMCLRGPREGMGGPCATDLDCRMDAECVELDGSRFCGVECVDGTCPPGFDCRAAADGNVCAPSGRVLGDACSENEDCQSGLCAHTDAGSVCTRFCDGINQCPQELECVRFGDGMRGACVTPELSRPIETTTCSASPVPSRRGHSLAWVLAAIGVVAAFRRRRRFSA